MVPVGGSLEVASTLQSITALLPAFGGRGANSPLAVVVDQPVARGRVRERDCPEGVWIPFGR
jgi:hypothetical protein